MIRDIKKNDCFYEGILYCPMFGKDIKISYEETVDKSYAEKCAEHLTNLNDDFIDKICKRISDYHQFMLKEWCDEFVKEINEKVPVDISGRDILNYVKNPTLNIFPPKEGIGYSIEGLCEWEPEHGIDIIIRDDRLLYVGQAECLGSWADDDEYEVMF
ncbi:hypothetical protein BCR32DRAFT_329017 [Anaeromyces robustus]|uniref:DUF6985 domain-containing protein n=1 Tax=Anaeromyces robustus TaxID=1754192 RepID=A0A1Y1WUX0_9FUNG|nr:hypothetical protein BCR32DRAFT_329017 [Anaeromyces robustus]|eukprot:ORX77205.1 hypothetical protein BCR32DRAFT_329017 [Anaeromyces robustus]